MNEACRLCVRVCRDKSVAILRNKLDFYVGETLMVRDFTGCLPMVNNHIGKPVSLWFG